ncbi:MAG: hypothetical protein V1792_03780 [Pseudomonadota bacterium]
MAVTLNIEAFVKDYCDGIPDREMLVRHRITAKEMIAVVKKLIQEGHISKDQYFGRNRKIQEMEARQEKSFLKSLYHCPVCSHIQPAPFSRCPACGHEISEARTIGESVETGSAPRDIRYDGVQVEAANRAGIGDSAEQSRGVVSVTPVDVPPERPEAVPQALQNLVGLPLESVSLLPGSPGDMAAEDFEVTEVIAAGAQSGMFKADPIGRSRPPVAVKVFLPELLPESDLKEVVGRITTYQSAMRDKNILTVFGTGTLAGEPAIIYEYLPETLEMLVEQEPEGLSEDILMSILPKMLNALGYSHMHRGTDGVVRRLPHLNLRLSRFYCDHPGGAVKLEGCGVWKSFVEVRDFKRRLWEEPGVDLSALAPEAFVLNSKFVNPFLADMYAMGAVIYKLATGRSAFSADDVKEYSFAHLRKFPIPPRVHRYQLPPWLDSMILKCLEKEPENRWRSATQMELHLGKDFSH